MHEGGASFLPPLMWCGSGVENQTPWSWESLESEFLNAAVNWLDSRWRCHCSHCSCIHPRSCTIWVDGSFNVCLAASHDRCFFDLFFKWFFVFFLGALSTCVAWLARQYNMPMKSRQDITVILFTISSNVSLWIMIGMYICGGPWNLYGWEGLLLSICSWVFCAWEIEQILIFSGTGF